MPSISSGGPPAISTSAKAIAVILKPLIDLHGEPRNWATAAPLYIEAQRDIPPNILQHAVRDAIANNPYFPKPAELRALAAGELAAYRRRAHDEWQASLPKPEPMPPPSPEDIAYVEELLRPMRKATAERTATLQEGT